MITAPSSSASAMCLIGAGVLWQWIISARRTPNDDTLPKTNSAPLAYPPFSRSHKLRWPGETGRSVRSDSIEATDVTRQPAVPSVYSLLVPRRSSAHSMSRWE